MGSKAQQFIYLPWTSSYTFLQIPLILQVHLSR
jgi:hypothetical protein